MTETELNLLHPGHVLERISQKEKIKVCNSHGSNCITCNKTFLGEKCLRHEKGNIYLDYECFKCYLTTIN